MKTFYDLLDTDTTLSIEIGIHSITDNGAPDAWISVNGKRTDYNNLEKPVEFSITVDLLEPLLIEIGMSGKQYDSEKETAVIVDTINIDGFEIVPNWIHLATHHNERGFNGPTNYLGFNGTWRLVTQEPFYQWRHHATSQGWLLMPTK